MNIYTYINLILYFFLIKENIVAQDNLLTNMHNITGFVNAANIGLYEGTYRAGIMYRSQWQKGNIKGYQVSGLYIDAPLSSFNNADWLGIGMNVRYDAIGEVALNTTNVGINMAYHKVLNSNRTAVLSAGFRTEFIERRIDRDKIVFKNDLTGNNPGLDQRLLNLQSQSYMDFSFGINFRNKTNNSTIFNIGASVEHLFTPQSNLSSNSDHVAKLSRQYTFYGMMDMPIRDKFLFTPMAYIFTSATGVEWMFQALGGVKINPENNTILRGGTGYQVSSQKASLLIGLEHQSFKVGVSYDFTLSKLSNSIDSQGTIELTVGYIGRIFKNKPPPSVILCPQY